MIKMENKVAVMGEPFHILLFSMGEIRYGFHASQILEVSDFIQNEPELHWFHEIARYPNPYKYIQPSVITLKNDEQSEKKIVIDRMESIVECYIYDLRPMPELLETRTNRIGIWGLFLLKDKPVILVDPLKMVAKNV